MAPAQHDALRELGFGVTAPKRYTLSFLLVDEAVAFNKDQRIVIISQRVTPETRQTASCAKTRPF